MRGHWPENEIREYETGERVELTKEAQHYDARGPPITLPQDDDIVVDTDLASRAVDMSRWQFCNLIRQGRGPRVTKFGVKKIGVRAGDQRAWIRSRIEPAE